MDVRWTVVPTVNVMRLQVNAIAKMDSMALRATPVMRDSTTTQTALVSHAALLIVPWFSLL